MTLRPKPLRILSYQLLSATIGAAVLWVALWWTGREANTILVACLIGSWIGSVVAVSRCVQRGTIRVWDQSISGPGPLSIGRVVLSDDDPARRILSRRSVLDRLNGAWWLETSSGRIRITKHWYRPADLDRFLHNLDLRAGRDAA